MKDVAGFRKSATGALVALFVLAGAAAALSACNTTAGFGEDMQAAGHAVTNSADRVKNGE